MSRHMISTGFVGLLTLAGAAWAAESCQFPAWSPDGNRIACVQKSESGDSLVLVHLETGSVEQVLAPGVHDGYFTSWHPSGEWLGFRSHNDGNAEAYKCRLDGTELVNLTDHESEDGVPFWSADGKSFAFRSNRGAGFDIFLQTEAGALQRLTTHPERDGVPFWNHRSGVIGFHSTRNGNWDLLVVDPSTKVVEALLIDQADNYLAAWSPDGRLVAFMSNRDTPAGSQSRKVHILSVDSGDVRSLVDVGEANFLPSWSPDSQRLAIHKEVDGAMQIFTVRANGNDLVQVTGLNPKAGNE
ncbi:MAG: hypothetical protein MPN21_19880 [Thermoanaerobaculia bacterium]|nr:hypothetical protein [Thermoanaerobaculia bacterium]